MAENNLNGRQLVEMVGYGWNQLKMARKPIHGWKQLEWMKMLKMIQKAENDSK